MDASGRTEELDSGTLSPLQGDDVQNNDNGTEYTVLPPSGIFTDVNMEGGECSDFSANKYQGQEFNSEQNNNNCEDTFGYCSYAPFQALTANGGCPFYGYDSINDNCSTASSEPISQDYPVDSCCCSPQYSNLDSAMGNFVNMDPNIAGMVGQVPQMNPNALPDMGYHDYNAHNNGFGIEGLVANMNQNPQSIYSNPLLMPSQPLMGMNAQHLSDWSAQNIAGYDENPLQSQAVYGANFQVFGGMGNNFNHFPNGTLMDIYMPEGMAELCPDCTDTSGTQASGFYGIGDVGAMQDSPSMSYPIWQESNVQREQYLCKNSD